MTVHRCLRLRGVPRAAVALWAAVAVLLAAGCDSELRSTLEVRGDDLTVEARVRLTGEAADAARENLDDLRRSVADGAGAGEDQVEITDRAGEVQARVPLDPGRLADTAELTGVAAAEVAGDDEAAERTVTVTVVRPGRLIDAVVAAAGDAAHDKADRLALTDAVLGTVEVVVAVTFPSGLIDAGFTPSASSVTTGAARLTLGEQTAELRQSLGRFESGTLTVSGDATPPAGGAQWWVAGGIVAGAALVAAWRRDQKRRQRHDSSPTHRNGPEHRR